MSHCIDYFAVVGKPGSLVCEEVRSSWEENKQCSPCDVWNDAITDIAVVTEHNKGSIDERWEVVNQSIDGLNFAENGIRICVAYLRRRISRRLDHITHVSLPYLYMLQVIY